MGRFRDEEINRRRHLRALRVGLVLLGAVAAGGLRRLVACLRHTSA